MTIDISTSTAKAIVRVDFNVPLDENGHITDDTRIRGAPPHSTRYSTTEEASSS